MGEPRRGQTSRRSRSQLDDPGFRSACEELGPVAVEAEPEPVAFADRVFGAVLANDYGVYDGLVAITFPALGEAGVTHPKGRLEQVSADRKAGVRNGDADAAKRALQDIADGQGDVDAFIAMVPAEERSLPHRTVEIGRRLLSAGRVGHRRFRRRRGAR